MIQSSNLMANVMIESLLAVPSGLHQYVAHHSVVPPVNQAMFTIWEGVKALGSFLTWWNILLIAFAMVNYKHIPFVYHLRVLNAVRFVCSSQRPKVEVKPEQLFQPLITSSRPCLLDIDVLGHKSNSTYFVDLDISRLHLVTTLFGNGIAKQRGSSTMNGLSGKKTSSFSIALGAVSCVFRKELRPYEQYDLWTRILSWDNKWVYVVTHFVKKGHKVDADAYTLYPHQHQGAQRDVRRMSEDGKPAATPMSPIAASGLSKIVFKDGRRTISPQELMGLANLIPTDPEILDAIEAERLRGMKMAENLAKQSDLDEEFESTTALGRHHDGMGVEGVVATLAQLGGLSKHQLL